MNKIIIHDAVKAHSGIPETELPENSTIRFEIGGKRYRIKITQFDRLEINKVTDDGAEEICIFSNSTNQITIS